MTEKDGKPKVLVLMGSDNDYDTVSPSWEILRGFGVQVRVEVTSAHRSPSRTQEIVKRSEEDGVEVIIAAAGYAAHLAGQVASATTLPVIGIPLDSSPLRGLDSLLSTVMMPAGIPVATVTVGKGGAKNAAYLALSILSIKYDRLRSDLRDFRASLEKGLSRLTEELNDKG